MVVTRLVAPQTAAVSAHVRCTPYNIQSHICRVHVYGEAGTCHPHLSQKDRDLYVLVVPGEANSPVTHAGTQTRDLLITSPAL